MLPDGHYAFILNQPYEAGDVTYWEGRADPRAVSSNGGVSDPEKGSLLEDMNNESSRSKKRA